MQIIYVKFWILCVKMQISSRRKNTFNFNVFTTSYPAPGEHFPHTKSLLETSICDLEEGGVPGLMDCGGRRRPENDKRHAHKPRPERLRKALTWCRSTFESVTLWFIAQIELLQTGETRFPPCPSAIVLSVVTPQKVIFPRAQMISVHFNSANNSTRVPEINLDADRHHQSSGWVIQRFLPEHFWGSNYNYMEIQSIAMKSQTRSVRSLFAHI